MAFWTDLKNSREPLRSNRWFIRFGDNTENSLDNFVYGLKECTKPSFDISVTEHTHISGHVYRNPGILKWKPINIKFASITTDVLDYSSTVPMSIEDFNINMYKGYLKYEKDGLNLSEQLMKTIQNFGYNIDGVNDNNINRHKGINNITNIDLIQTDNYGQEQEIWNLNKVFLSNINFGNLAYNSDDIVDISMTINYDFAKVKGGNRNA